MDEEYLALIGTHRYWNGEEDPSKRAEVALTIEPSGKARRAVVQPRARFQLADKQKLLYDPQGRAFEPGQTLGTVRITANAWTNDVSCVFVMDRPEGTEMDGCPGPLDLTIFPLTQDGTGLLLSFKKGMSLKQLPMEFSRLPADYVPLPCDEPEMEVSLVSLTGTHQYSWQHEHECDL